MKKNLMLLLSLICMSAPATPVLFTMQSLTGLNNNRAILIQPDRPQSPLVIGTNLVPIYDFTLQPVGGQVLTNLVPWGYTIKVDGWPRAAHIIVPSGDDVINAATLINTNNFAPLNIFITGGTNSISIFPGTNVSFQSSGGSNIISADVSYSEVTNAAAQAAKDATNGFGNIVTRNASDFDAAGAANAATNGLPPIAFTPTNQLIFQNGNAINTGTNAGSNFGFSGNGTAITISSGGNGFGSGGTSGNGALVNIALGGGGGGPISGNGGNVNLGLAGVGGGTPGTDGTTTVGYLVSKDSILSDSFGYADGNIFATGGKIKFYDGPTFIDANDIGHYANGNEMFDTQGNLFGNGSGLTKIVADSLDSNALTNIPLESLKVVPLTTPITNFQFSWVGQLNIKVGTTNLFIPLLTTNGFSN